MLEIRLHRELYGAASVQAALEVYKPYASIELAEEPSYWRVQVTGKSPGRERRLVREFSNYALGITIRERGTA